MYSYTFKLHAFYKHFCAVEQEQFVFMALGAIQTNPNY